MKWLAIIVASIWAPLAFGQAWDTTDKALLAASTALLIVDWGQTRYIAKHPAEFHEKNPILGKHPSVGRVNTYFAAAVIGNYAMAELLGPEYRAYWLGGMAALELTVTARNKGLGIKLDF